MTPPSFIADEDVHAYLDGELAGDRARAIAEAASADPDLYERIAAFRADKQHLRAAYAGVAEAPIPDAWRARIEAATAPPKLHLLRPGVARSRLTLFALAPGLALAACLALFLLAHPTAQHTEAADTILAEATAARQDSLPALTRLTGTALQNTAARNAALVQAVGLKLRVPDLSAQHWRLTELETYRHAAALRYRSETGQSLTVYVRQSGGTPRFDLLKDGAVRTCVWQDEVVGTVMMGEMSAGQMMRVASAAYLALNL